MCVLALWSRAYDGAQVPEGEEGRTAVGQVPDGGGDHGPGHLTTSATSTAMIVTKTNKKITLDATLGLILSNKDGRNLSTLSSLPET
jgi:hypothetical protein